MKVAGESDNFARNMVTCVESGDKKRKLKRDHGYFLDFHSSFLGLVLRSTSLQLLCSK